MALPIPRIAKNLVELVTTLIEEIRPQLIRAALTGDYADRINVRHADNFLSDFDIQLHERYRELLTAVIPAFIYASEEADPQIIGSDRDPDLCVLVDPLDTSEMAVRSLYGYTHVLVYSRKNKRPVAAVVGDIFHQIQAYVAACDESGRDHAWLFERGGISHPLHLHGSVPLREALVTNFLMKPGRFEALAKQDRLFSELDQSTHGRIGVDFGSISLCHVAAGLTDSVIEFAKGFAVWDLAPGHYILNAAGGVVVDLDGRPIPMDYGFATTAGITQAMDERHKFVAASSMPLAQEIIAALNKG